MFAGEKRRARTRTQRDNSSRLLQHGFWKHLLAFFVGHDDLDDGRLPSALKRSIVVVDVGWKEEFGVEKKPLERRKVGDL